MILVYFVTPVSALVPTSCMGHFGQCSNAGLRSGTCWVACITNADCQDGDTSTTNTCRNPGTTASFCNHNDCGSNTADANNDRNDGCEVDLLTDANNCGSVGNVCGACINGACCNANVDQSCGSCGRGTTQCDGSCSGDSSTCGSEGWKNTGSGCGNCGTQQRYCNGCDLTNSFQCVGEGVCSPTTPETRCENNRHQTCSSSCSYDNSGTDADSDGVDQQCGDTTCDNAVGVCDTLVSGKCIAKTTNEDACTDNLDNNCNGNIDCSDTDCAGTISGNVKNIDDKNIDNARIDTLQGVTAKQIAYTQPSGIYQINDVLCGTYNIIVSEPDHISSTKTITLAPKESKTVDFTGNDALVLGSTCEVDCTTAVDSIIHSECEGINGCAFYNEDGTGIAKKACNFAQPGWLRDYVDTANCPEGGCIIEGSETCVNCSIECPDGIPQIKKETKASVTCELENLLKKTKVIVYKGKLVKLNIVTCR